MMVFRHKENEMRMAVAVSVVFCSGLGAQEKPNLADPGGWTTAKWGMTKDQIVIMFPEA